MIKMVEPMMAEFQKEAQTTRNVLERVPANKLGWKPHPKSMSLGQLALHIAQTPSHAARDAESDEFDVSTLDFNNVPTPHDTNEILRTHDASVKAAEEFLEKLSESAAVKNWRARFKDKEILAIPRIGMLRTIMLNHWYHHRGQLSVYLRLLDIPVPIIYGRSADESMFG
jgi:uncharacterized damage-inducible protein DinB